MIRPREHSESQSFSQVHFCFLSPAWLPEWFWQPVAHAVLERGANYTIPALKRDVPDVTVEQNVDIVESALQGRLAQYLVVLSRGIEYGVRYVDRMKQKGRLQNIIGMTVISSPGPKGYETKLHGYDTAPSRHTEQYLAGVVLDESGLEVLDPDVARNCMLHDVDDPQLQDQIIRNLIKGRPLTDAEIANVPTINAHDVPITWRIGSNDQVDNTEVSAAVARQIFRVEPIFADWGHVSPLTHTEQVTQALLMDAETAASLEKREYHAAN